MGLERAGMTTVAFCEIDEHCRKVLRKHWPRTQIIEDIRQLNAPRDSVLMAENIDVVCGGFPCQDISIGGSQKGVIHGERSSLWKEYKRLINEIRPKYVIIENVENLRKNGLGVILHDLYEISFDAEWHCITAASVGLLHQRDRIWIIAYPSSKRLDEHIGQERHLQTYQRWENKTLHTEGEKCEFESLQVCKILPRGKFDEIRSSLSCGESSVSEVRRVTHGIPVGLDERRRKQRIKQLGNAVVPIIPEIIGRAIMEYEENL